MSRPGRSGVDLHLDLPRGPGGTGRALERALREAIRDGRLPAGTRLPGTRSLAADLGLARGTLVQAYAQLTGAQTCLATANGTSALFTALNAMGIEPGDEVIVTPYTFIGHRLAQSMLRPHVISFLDVASAFRKSADLDLDLEQVPVSASSFLNSRTLGQLRLGAEYGVIVLAIQHKECIMQFNPPADVHIESGDVLIAMGERNKLKRLEQESKSR